MGDKTRGFYYFILGALGGATGWYLAESLVSASSPLNRPFYGIIFGGSIGFSIAAFDALAGRSFVRFLKYGGVGLLLGGAAGGIAVPLAFWVYATLLDPHDPAWKIVAVGITCWILMGGIIGFGEGVGKGTEKRKGVLGGVIGGLVGGGAYEIARLLGQTDSSNSLLILALSMTILGGAIGGAVAVVTMALKRAWIDVLEGGMAGKRYDVTKYVHRELGSRKPGIIGSARNANIFLPGDEGIGLRHAQISNSGGRPTLTVLAEQNKKQSVLLNGRPVSSSPLRDGDHIQISRTKLLYRHKRERIDDA